MIRLRACWVTQALSGLAVTPGEVDAPARKLDEEQDVEALEEHCVDGEEVALDDARRLPT
jgi:hypothetical protein